MLAVPSSDLLASLTFIADTKLVQFTLDTVELILDHNRDVLLAVFK